MGAAVSSARSARSLRSENGFGPSEPNFVANMNKVIKNPLDSQKKVHRFNFVAFEDDEVDMCFQEWLTVFGMENWDQITIQEFNKRKQIWRDNNKKIRDHNKNSFGKTKSYYLTHNQFSAMTLEELKQYTGAFPSQEDLPRRNLARGGNKGGGDGGDGGTDPPPPEPPTVETPPYIKYDETIMGPVKSQGACGACYAFSTNTQIEGAVMAIDRANGGSKTYQRLSEQSIIDCSSASCQGGYIEQVYYWILGNGLMADADYGYTQVESTCQYDQSKVVTTISNAFSVPSDWFSIGDQLQSIPMQTQFSISFDFYYLDGLNPMLPSDTSICDPAAPVGSLFGHSVAIIGYDPTPTQVTTEEILTCRTVKRNRSCQSFEFKASSTQCCWYEIEETPADPYGHIILQNQWGNVWGDNGYFRVALGESGSGWCGAQENISFAVPIV